MVFEDHPNENIYTSFKNAHSTNKRSISNNDRDIEVEELMNIDDSDEHWLWGSMKRIRRSIDKLLGTENPSEVSQSTERQPKHVRKPMIKHRKKVLVNGEKQKVKKNFKNVGNSKSIGGKTLAMRPKRQDYEYQISEDDEDEEEDDEILEPIASGSSSLPEVEQEVSEKEDRLCK